ncbi:hypothetical protein Tco_0204910 [Tanacetum coccineum]
MARPSQGDKGYVRPAWTGGPERAKNRDGPREERRNMGVYTPYPRKDTFTPLTKTLKEILAMESISFLEPPPLIETPKKQNLNKLCDYHGDRGHPPKQLAKWEPMKEWCEGHKHDKTGRKPQEIFEERRSEGIIEGNQVRRIHVDGGSSSEIMYEHCFRNLSVNIRLRLRRCTIPMIGFSKETYHPQGVIDLRVTLGKEGRSKMVLMEFAIIKFRSPYNIIIRRTRMRSLGAVGSTIYSMIKFPTNQGVVIMETSGEALQECKHLERVQGSWKEGLLQIRCHLKEHGAERMQKKHSPSAMNFQTDYSSLNKVCAKGMYPLSEEGEELASLMGYPYKCFLRLPKEYSQIRMAEGDKEKTGFHTEEGKRDNKLCIAGRKGRNPDASFLFLKKRCIHVIRLKFKASNHAIDCEALLARLAAFANQGMKDLHVFIDSLTLVAQVEGNHTPVTEQERRAGNYKARIPQPGSIGRSQGEAIRLRVGGMTQDLLDGQQHIYCQFSPSSEQQVFSGISRAPPLTENGYTKKERKRKERRRKKIET